MKLLLLNPKRKSTVKKGATMFKRRKRATAHKTKRAIKRRRNPTAVATVSSAPRKSIRRRARTHVAAATRRIKRRVSGLGGSSKLSMPAIKNTVMQGGMAGLGAIGADIVAGQLMKYLPDSLKTAQMQPFAQVAVSLLAGFAIGKVNGKAGNAIAVGGVTVATYNLAKSLLKTSGIPGLSAYDNNLNGYDYDPSYGMGNYNPLRSVQSTNPLSGNTMFNSDVFNTEEGIGMYDNGSGINY